jgi:hypothetical protein
MITRNLPIALNFLRIGSSEAATDVAADGTTAVSIVAGDQQDLATRSSDETETVQPTANPDDSTSPSTTGGKYCRGLRD